MNVGEARVVVTIEPIWREAPQAALELPMTAKPQPEKVPF